MQKTLLLAALTLPLAGLFGAPAAHAACEAGKPGSELTGDEAQAVYDCLSGDLLAGYQGGDTAYIPADRVADYRKWEKVSTFPAAPGFHGGRFLVTWVNETGADAYKTYAEDPEIPEGTLIAKESFAVNDEGVARRGPLFFMEKVAAGSSPDTLDWFYYTVLPNGNPLNVNVMQACNTCHVENFGHQDGLGYPVEDARVH